ncbi:hypothetical protein [Emticicia sp. TH156]|uniref:hypothetical protein n=1 Tax=Emticicia sp. TH156 TaxID=2067454 RepID=UPI001E42C4D0|nr:hypothetical protein [Emticicia sp. TH156]
MVKTMVEVFKTNIKERTQARAIFEILSKHFPYFKINFDLEDCDKILRIEGEGISNERIISLITTNGYYCQILE